MKCPLISQLACLSTLPNMLISWNWTITGPVRICIYFQRLKVEDLDDLGSKPPKMLHSDSFKSSSKNHQGRWKSMRPARE